MTSSTDPAQAPEPLGQVPIDEPQCDHICLKDEGHVERGEPHFYGYRVPGPWERYVAMQRERDEFAYKIANSWKPENLSLRQRVEELERERDYWKAGYKECWDALDKAEAEVQRLRGEVELWREVGEAIVEGKPAWCPACEWHFKTAPPHATDCPLDAVLKLRGEP
jgi:hypothetical protein